MPVDLGWVLEGDLRPKVDWEELVCLLGLELVSSSARSIKPFVFDEVLADGDQNGLGRRSSSSMSSVLSPMSMIFRASRRSCNGLLLKRSLNLSRPACCSSASKTCGKTSFSTSLAHRKSRCS